ncbi:Like-Sm (LSM) domain containing protein, LSm4/SmD1/SmD3 [Kipferlia bialata]|uniref:Like-Sm (LSM) domain containing protein, LSm4/SmD1/SmD3 n=1 Tax=Kipferlia bialata TaxID=797122 RepID=A0A9K3CTE6_9EUKA|nr:Like-Sm (LSM) domain containing protein, LSm4/SmD1/SmD3 [Kipferlia bialata]GIQ82607.1 Like-Sm (LSM) domain containing protein, LSm4/SmD1/SmD3 [Kipferlia bialata]|eukprot:g802.t1
MKLVRFVQRLRNETVTLELKTGASVRGTVVGVDNAMSVTVRAARLTVPNKETKSIPLLVVRGTTIRNVLLSETLNLDVLLVDDRPKQARKSSADKGAKKGGYKGRNPRR